MTPLAPLRDARSQQPATGPSPLPPAGQPASDAATPEARLFDALAAPGPQDAPPLPSHPHHHHVHGRPTPARRLSSRSRRGMSAGDDDAEIDATPPESETEQAAQAGLAVAKGAPEHGSDGSGQGGGGRGSSGEDHRQGRRGADPQGPVPGKDAREPASAGAGPAAATGVSRPTPSQPGTPRLGTPQLGTPRPGTREAEAAGQAPPARTAMARIVPARLPPQTPALLERNATAKLPLATRMARAHPHRGVSALFAFTGQSLYSPAKRLAGMLWWADWRAMRNHSRLAVREAPRAGRLKPPARVAYAPSFVPAPPAAAVFRQPPRGRPATQRWDERPDTAGISAFPVHCGEPYGLRAALAWQARVERRSLRQRSEALAQHAAATEVAA